VFELHGDFYQIGANTYCRPYIEAAFKTVFAGSGEQRVSFERQDGNASLGRVAKASASPLRLLTPTHSLSLISDMTLAMSNNAGIASLNLNGHTARFTTPATLTNVNLGGGAMVFDEAGNLTLNGTLNVNGGLLDVRGNLNIVPGGCLATSRDEYMADLFVVG
jgi:hypothetical protein